MPVMPAGFITLRIFQLIIAITTFGVSIWLLVNWGSLGSILSVTASSLNLIILFWVIPAEKCAPSAYNYWAVLTFEVILFATYLTALIWSSLEAYFWGWDYYYSDCSDYDYSTHSYIDNPSCRARRDLLNGMSIAGAVLCGVMSVFYLTSLIIVGSAVTKHRNAGGHNFPGSQPPAPMLYQPGPYIQYPIPVYIQQQPGYQQPPQMQGGVGGQKEPDYAALQQQIAQLQARQAELEHQIERGQTMSPSVDRNGSNV